MKPKYVIVEIVNDTHFNKNEVIYRIKKRTWYGKYKFLKCKCCVCCNFDSSIAFVDTPGYEVFNTKDLNKAKQFKNWLLKGNKVFHSKSFEHGEFVFAKFHSCEHGTKFYSIATNIDNLENVKYSERIVG